MVPPQWMLVSQPEQLLHSQAQKCFPIEAKRKRKLIQLVESVSASGDTRQIFLSRVSTSEYRQPPSIRRVFQTNAHR